MTDGLGCLLVAVLLLRGRAEWLALTLWAPAMVWSWDSANALPAARLMYFYLIFVSNTTTNCNTSCRGEENPCQVRGCFYAYWDLTCLLKEVKVDLSCHGTPAHSASSGKESFPFQSDPVSLLGQWAQGGSYQSLNQPGFWPHFLSYVILSCLSKQTLRISHISLGLPDLCPEGKTNL